MAERRMFAKSIVDSDAFLDMPLSAQALYFHLSMRADDEGFVNNPRKIQRMIGASDDDCKLLLLKKFVIAFESGIVVIKHWRIHNYIQKDRFKETTYQDERKLLSIKENGAYTMDTKCIQDVSISDTQDSIGKYSIDKYSIERGLRASRNEQNGNNVTPMLPESGNETEKNVTVDKDIEKETRKPQKRFTAPTLEEVKSYCQERNNNVDAERFIDYYSSKGWLVGKSPMKDWKAAVRTWEKNGFDQPKTQSKFYQDDDKPEGFDEIWGR